MSEPSRESMELLISLMSAGHAMTTGTMDSLIHSLTYQGRRDEAVLALARATVLELVDAPYVPNPSAFASALYPSADAIEQWLADHYGPDWRDPAARKLRGCGTCC